MRIWSRTSILMVIAALMLMGFGAAVLPARAGSVGMSYSFCLGGGYSYQYGSYTAGGTYELYGNGGCFRQLQFSWWSLDGSGWVANSWTSGYSDRYNSIGVSTDGKSQHKLGISFLSSGPLCNTQSWTTYGSCP